MASFKTTALLIIFGIMALAYVHARTSGYERGESKSERVGRQTCGLTNDKCHESNANGLLPCCSGFCRRKSRWSSGYCAPASWRNL